jgi:hypothetical protein
MKRLLLFAFLIPQLVFAQSSNSTRLQNFKKSYQYQEMDSVNELSRGTEYDFYKAVYFNVTNNPVKSNKHLQKKRNNHLKNTFDYVKLMNDNAAKSFDYKLAYETSSQLVQKFKTELGEDELVDEINTRRIWELLINTRKQTISPLSSVTLKTKRDLAGLITTEVNANNYSSNFVFDTGAGMSCITESEAKKMNLTILPDNDVSVQSFSGEYNRVRIGIAKELHLGDITVKNAIFLVYPDAAFSFADGKYVINGIFGFPIAKELGIITLEADQMTLHKGLRPDFKEKNFFVDLLRPIVIIDYKGKKLPCNFDSGANNSSFTRSFYELFHDHVDAMGRDEKTTSAGAGATLTETAVKVLPNEEFKIGTAKITLPRFSVDTNNYGVFGKENFGNIGQDVLKQFKKVTFSFEHNYLSLEN